jgi:hypothetical protein
MIDCYLYEGKSETKFSCYFWVSRDRKSMLMCFDMWPYFLFTWSTTCSGTCHSICWHFQSPSSRRRHPYLKYNLPFQWWCCHQIEIANLRFFHFTKCEIVRGPSWVSTESHEHDPNCMCAAVCGSALLWLLFSNRTPCISRLSLLCQIATLKYNLTR